MVKQAMLARFWAIYRRKMGELAFGEPTSPTRLLDMGRIYSDKCQHGTFGDRGNRSAATAIRAGRHIDAESTLDPGIPLADAAPAQPPLGEEEVRTSDSEWEDDSSTTSSSASDVSGPGAELESLPPLDDAVDGMLWFRQGAKTHIVRAKDDEHRSIPWCGDVAFTQDAKASGVGFGTCSRAIFCQRCLVRLPRGAYLALADLCGWLH